VAHAPPWRASGVRDPWLSSSQAVWPSAEYGTGTAARKSGSGAGPCLHATSRPQPN
jgi:hypothetical protein